MTERPLEEQVILETAGRVQEVISELKKLCEEGLDSTGEHGRKSLHLRILQLREHNRTMSMLQREHKRRVHTAKTAVDRTELSRQNLLYERRHLQACIQDAHNHPSLYLSIPLESGHDNKEHEIMLKSLQDELSERQMLAEKLKSSQESLELARSRLVLKQKEFEKIRDQLSTIIKAADPFLNSHSRLFAELEKAATAATVGDKPHESSNGQEVQALERLLQHWLLFAEGHEGVSVALFEELEAGEDGDQHDGMASFGEDEDDDEMMASMSGDESVGGGGNNRALHARFTSSAKKAERRFAFAHLVVKIVDQMDRDLKVYFYPADPSGDSELVLVVRVEGESLGHMSCSDAEDWLLALDIDPIMKLTIPHETIVPREAGHIPFRWIQSLADVLPDASFSEPQAILKKFTSALKHESLRERAESHLLQSGSHQFESELQPTRPESLDGVTTPIIAINADLPNAESVDQMQVDY